jgi:hypothetical protein
VFNSDNVKITKIKAAVATGTTTQTATVDMQGYDGVIFMASLGTPSTTVGVKVGQGAASNGSDASDLAGSKQLSDGTITDFVSDLIRPDPALGRYLTLSIIRATNTTTVESAWAILYKSRSVPVTNASTTQAVKKQLTPALGTA